MESTVKQTKQKVALWVQNHKHAVLYDDESSTLRDVASGKSAPLPWRELSGFEEKIHSETKETYLVLLFENGNQLALVDPGGVAFAPSVVNTGPIDLPPVVCLRDFYVLKQRIDHYLYDHPDEPPPRETLDMIMICIATLDGARAVGFDVGDLESELEKSLNEVERRTK
ncbi:MAG TPA: hypothetical protein VHV54_23255 [Candidatus Binatia bacterium]|nr:hypothetical protein [Candidatus Binatia bacterium]